MAVSRIHRLPPELANQIAAGEVVERPASVVKELVENAIDAGARRIAIAIEFGGKKLIAVEDDGEGMTAEEASLALERHATSKIRTAQDLAAIVTLGFRGEALPSIASVSRFRLRTRARGTEAGTDIRVHAGRTVSAREVGAPEGTRIEVADLFFNLPARRKFLKADTAETTQVSRLVTQMALGYPDVGFVLQSGPRVVLEPMRIDPLSGSSLPTIIRSRVVLPAPLGPMMPTMEPGGTVAENLSRIRRSSKDLVMLSNSKTTSPSRGPGGM
jgi:DNA mismatch repair protein MutL